MQSFKSTQKGGAFLQSMVALVVIIVAWMLAPRLIGALLEYISATSTGSTNSLLELLKSIPGLIKTSSGKEDINSSYGALSTLFAGLAFAGVVISLGIQRKAMDSQAKASANQSFEHTFFQMLQMHCDLRDSVITKHNNGEYLKGIAAIQEIYQVSLQVPLSKDSALKQEIHTGEEAALVLINNAFNGYQKGNHDVLGPYLRSVYQILKYIDNSGLDNPKFYSSLFRAHLSTYELYFLFLNCLAEAGGKAFKLLAVDYELFKHLTLIDQSLFTGDILTLYPDSSFGSNNELLEARKIAINEASQN